MGNDGRLTTEAQLLISEEGTGGVVLCLLGGLCELNDGGLVKSGGLV